MRRPLEVIRAYPPHDGTLHGLLASRLAANPGRPFLSFGGETLSYAQFAQRVAESARGLAARGIARGDRVGVMATNSARYVILFFALARLGAVIYLARYLVKKRDRLDDFFRDFLPPMIVIGAVLALIMGESDLGTAAVMGMVAGLMLFIGGARGRHLWVMGLLALPVLYAMIMKIGYRRQRMMAFLDPWRDPTAYPVLGEGKIMSRGQDHCAGRVIDVDCPVVNR